MRLLVIYQLDNRASRNTIKEHLGSFKKYGKNASVHYFNVFSNVPSWLNSMKYDAILLHYTFLAGERFQKDELPWIKKTEGLAKLSGLKIAMPQDEYDNSDRLCKLFCDYGIKIVFTCFTRQEDIEKVYTYHNSKSTIFKNNYTGYIDEMAVKRLKKRTKPLSLRSIEIGYRARKLSPVFGRHGQLKYELVLFFLEYLKDKRIKYDINNTNQTLKVEDKNSVKLGSEWYNFLLSCKSFIGCEGGSSLLDSDGKLKESINSYLEIFPNATFDEIEMACFNGFDFQIKCFAISPRHFEAAICKTLQILVEGDYGGIFIPWKHYIPLKRDFTNIDEVMSILKDTEKCQAIVDNCYTDIVLSEKYTYKSFVDYVFREIEGNISNAKNSSVIFYFFGLFLYLRNNNLHFWLLFKRLVLLRVVNFYIRIRFSFLLRLNWFKIKIIKRR